MTDTAGPFDGSPWAEAQWARHAASWAQSGVYGTPAASTTTGDLPLSVSGRTVGLGAGRAWVRGFGFERTGAAVLQDPGANTHASFSRRDRIVLRRNLATHTLTPVFLIGTPSGSPAAPALTRSETGSWDLPMFSFLVPPNSGTAITGIVDERGWILPDTGDLGFLTSGARDANLPSPATGSVCTVAGVLEKYSGTGWESPESRIILRSHTPVSTGIPAGASRESGVADGPAITPFDVPEACRVQVVAQFRLGTTNVSAGWVTNQVKVNGVVIASGIARWTDSTMTLVGTADVPAGSNTVALTVAAVGADGFWHSSQLSIVTGKAG